MKGEVLPDKPFSTLIYAGSNISAETMANKRYIRKVCLLGDGGVGKTSLIRRFVLDVFNDEYVKTFGTKVSKKVIEVGENQLTMMIWDILGQKAHSSLHEAYYKGAHGALLVSDLTQEATVISLRRWKEELIAVTGGIPIIPVANKYDLEGRVSDEVLRDAEERIGRPFVITSAKTGEGVEQAFLDLAERILEGRI